MQSVIDAFSFALALAAANSEQAGMDRLTKERRSWLMSRVRGKNTRPEWTVRRLLHSLGFRFRLHRNDLPGTPDIVFVGMKKAIFVHGCFWHGHGCKIGRPPESRKEYWIPTIEATRVRDGAKATLLKQAGWDVLVVWQCETRDKARLATVLCDFLGQAKNSIDIAPAND